MIRILIVGAGDIARRLLPTLVPRFHVFALIRDPAKAAWWRANGAHPLLADLDDRTSLRRLRGLAHWVLHFAPAGETLAGSGAAGSADLRTRRLIATLSSRGSLPQRLVYISTSGVYGDCGGARFDETRRLAPATARAARRVDAERQLRRWSASKGVRTSILRVPGIYAEERLPLARLGSGTPVLRREDDVFTNHVHADDLAHSVWCALRRGRSNRVYHVSDDAELPMGDYFDCLADAFALPRPQRVARAEAAGRIAPMLLSFMSESRRLDNRRLKGELGVRLRWPRVDDAVRRMAANSEPRRAKCS